MRLSECFPKFNIPMPLPHQEGNQTMQRYERLARAVCPAWGLDPDETHILPGGEIGKMWQAPRIQETVLAFIAMYTITLER